MGRGTSKGKVSFGSFFFFPGRTLGDGECEAGGACGVSQKKWWIRCGWMGRRRKEDQKKGKKEKKKKQIKMGIGLRVMGRPILSSVGARRLDQPRVAAGGCKIPVRSMDEVFRQVSRKSGCSSTQHEGRGDMRPRHRTPTSPRCVYAAWGGLGGSMGGA